MGIKTWRARVETLEADVKVKNEACMSGVFELKLIVCFQVWVCAHVYGNHNMARTCGDIRG